jgi:hypothetical protein
MMRARRRLEAGATVVELLVSLLVMGLLAGMAGLALTMTRPNEDPVADRLASARALAVRSGRAVSVVADSTQPGGGTGGRVLFLPDGRAVGAGVDQLTGEVRGGAR